MAEPLMSLPDAPYPATIETVAVVGDNATVAFRGNRYSVPPGLSGTPMTMRQRLGSQNLEVFTPLLRDGQPDHVDDIENEHLP